jgi:hypothetical protein
VTKGIYLLANDAVVDRAVALINSITAVDRSLPICVIPFDNATAKLRSRLNRHVQFYEDVEFLHRCDQISVSIHHMRFGHFRKLAIWRGPFEAFIYIDVDALLIGGIEYIYSLLNEFDILVGHSNSPASRRWVWKDTIYDLREFSDHQIEYAGMTGIIASKRGLVDDSIISSARRKLPTVLQHMELCTIEQSFLNLLFVTAGFRCSNIHRPDVIGELWGGNKHAVFDNQLQLYFRGRPMRATVIHWAGLWHFSRAEIWWRRLHNALSLDTELSPIPIGLRHRHLWLHYWNRCRLSDRMSLC